MKKIIFALLIVGLLAIPAWGAEASSIKVYVDGEQIHFPDQQPYIDKNDRTLVPVRFVSEALDAEVDWIQEREEVVVNHQTKNKEILLWIGKKDYTVNGEKATMDTQAVLTKKLRTMVPLRFVSEALDAEVRWELVSGKDIVHTFTLNQSDEEINAIMAQIRAEIEGTADDNVTIIPESEWSYDKPYISGGYAHYFCDPDVKIAYATVDQLPIKTEHYIIKSIDRTKTHIIISYDTPSQTTPSLYITEGSRLWVLNAYIHGKTSIDYKYAFDDYIYGKDYTYDPLSWGEDYIPITYKKLEDADYLNICIDDYILAIENPFKNG